MIDDKDQWSMITLTRFCVGIASESGVMIFMNEFRLPTWKRSVWLFVVVMRSYKDQRLIVDSNVYLYRDLVCSASESVFSCWALRFFWRGIWFAVCVFHSNLVCNVRLNRHARTWSLTNINDRWWITINDSPEGAVTNPMGWVCSGYVSVAD